jgi:hypothetical protein
MGGRSHLGSAIARADTVNRSTLRRTPDTGPPDWWTPC